MPRKVEEVNTITHKLLEVLLEMQSPGRWGLDSYRQGLEFEKLIDL